MIINTEINLKTAIADKAKAYFELLKFRLSLTVAFSGSFGYLLGIEHFEWDKFLVFSFAGFLLTGGANIINQIIEKDLDKLMKRTHLRPIPTERVSRTESAVFSIFLFIVSFTMLWQFSVGAALVGLLSYILYGFVYTPLKRVGPIAVFVGAFPGAFPPMIGWVAATGHFGLEPGILFAIQFFWQFPHFFAIAWVADEDYKKAGFRLLPNNGTKDLNTAIQIMIYTLFLLPLSFVPYYLGMTGINSAFVTLVCGILFLAQTFQLMRNCNDKTALRLMFASFIYLPIVQIAFLLDKI